jgi:hypothetical protein
MVAAVSTISPASIYPKQTAVFHPTPVYFLAKSASTAPYFAPIHFFSILNTTIDCWFNCASEQMERPVRLKFLLQLAEVEGAIGGLIGRFLCHF